MNKISFCGIYQIRNLVNGKIYIGSSNNILKRWMDHKRDLKFKKHHCQKLSRAWNKYGEDNFIFEIIEQCSMDNLFSREQYWMNLKLYADSNDRRFHNFGYNDNRIANRPPKVDWTGRQHSEKTKRKISLSKKGKKLSDEHRTNIGKAVKGKMLGAQNPMYGVIGKDHPSYGKKRSRETCTKIALNKKNNKLNPEKVKQIKLLLTNGNSHRSIAEKYNISIKYIWEIKAGKCWGWVKND